MENSDGSHESHGNPMGIAKLVSWEWEWLDGNGTERNSTKVNK